MRFLIEAHHPADIHFWKFALQELSKRGHEHLVLSRDRDVMKRLLDRHPYINAKTISKAGSSNRFPLKEFLQRQSGVFRHILSFRPDVVASCMGSYTQTAGLLRKPNLVFTDSEFQNFNHKIAHPFASEIHTPECFEKDLGRKQSRYRGFHELAFLSPKYFRRDDTVGAMLDKSGNGYAILRVSAWNTLHDVGFEGLGPKLREVIAYLKTQMTVWISPEEGRIDEDLKHYQLAVHPDDYHQALAGARIVVTEGASTASEAAVLGVPTLYVNPSMRGYLDYLETRYGLVRQCRDPNQALEGIHALEREIEGADWSSRVGSLIEDHDDVVEYIAASLETAGKQGRNG